MLTVFNSDCVHTAPGHTASGYRLEDLPRTLAHTSVHFELSDLVASCSLLLERTERSAATQSLPDTAAFVTIVSAGWDTKAHERPAATPAIRLAWRPRTAR